MARPVLFTKEQLKQKRKELDSCSIKIIGSKQLKDKFDRFVKSKNKSKKQVLIDILNSNKEFKNFI